jgi:hypothetical protein
MVHEVIALFLEGFPNSFIHRPTLELLFDIMRYESAIAVEVRTQVPQICYFGCYLFETVYQMFVCCRHYTLSIRSVASFMHADKERNTQKKDTCM